MTQADAAKVIDAARTTMVAIEKGRRRLKATELIKLARAYGRSVSDFVRPRPVVQPFEVQFRRLQSSQAEEAQITPVIQRLEELCRNYLELEEMMPGGHFREIILKITKSKICRLNLRQRVLRSQNDNDLDLVIGPIPLWSRDIFEQGVGLRIFYLKMPAKYSEIYIYNEQLGGCMAINANHPEERCRWSLAHGYLHFLAHRYKAVIDL